MDQPDPQQGYPNYNSNGCHFMLWLFLAWCLVMGLAFRAAVNLLGQ